jgi:hypothetical protein
MRCPPASDCGHEGGAGGGRNGSGGNGAGTQLQAAADENEEQCNSVDDAGGLCDWMLSRVGGLSTELVNNVVMERSHC